MTERILGWLTLTVGVLLFASRVAARFSPGCRPWQWAGGVKSSMTGELAGCAFVVCIGLGILTRHRIWIGLGVTVWLFVYLAERRDRRRHQRSEDALRASNSARHPGVSDQAPPQDIDAVCDERLRLFDAGACTCLGDVSKRDVQALIKSLAGMAEDEVNDIFVVEESLELLEGTEISPEFVDVLREGFKSRDFLILRWMPPLHR